MLKLVDGEWLLDSEAVPASFFPYSTIVRDRILEMPYKADDAVDRLCKELIRLFNEAGIKCQADNKIAFGLIGQDGKTYYIGFKDWKMSLGTQAVRY